MNQLSSTLPLEPGYAENSDSWAPLAADLMKDHTVVVPDLRGIGRSSKPTGGYDKKTQAKDIRAVVTALGFDRTFVVQSLRLVTGSRKHT